MLVEIELIQVVIITNTEVLLVLHVITKCFLVCLYMEVSIDGERTRWQFFFISETKRDFDFV